MSLAHGGRAHTEELCPLHTGAVHTLSGYVPGTQGLCTHRGRGHCGSTHEREVPTNTTLRLDLCAFIHCAHSQGSEIKASQRDRIPTHSRHRAGALTAAEVAPSPHPTSPAYSLPFNSRCRFRTQGLARCCVNTVARLGVPNPRASEMGTLDKSSQQFVLQPRLF